MFALMKHVSVKNTECLVHDAAVICRTLPVLSPCLHVCFYVFFPRKMSKKSHQPFHLQLSFICYPTSVHHVLYLEPEGFTHLNVSGCTVVLCAVMHIL